MEHFGAGRDGVGKRVAVTENRAELAQRIELSLAINSWPALAPTEWLLVASALKERSGKASSADSRLDLILRRWSEFSLSLNYDALNSNQLKAVDALDKAIATARLP